jgi:hypothetical protein
MPGRHLYRFACTSCSDFLRENVVAPAIADFQHQYAAAAGTAARIHALVSGYTTVWRTLAWCLVRDARSPESRAFHSMAATAFLVAVGVTASIEYLLFETNAAIHRLAMYVPYLYWSYLSTTTTLEFGVPLAMFPALLFARAQSGRPAAASLTTCAAAMLLTLASTSWLAPTVARQRTIRSHGEYVRATGGRLYIDPLEWALDRSPESKSWPALVRGARRGPVHRYPGYPHYVAPGDAMLPHAHRQEILNRLFLAALGLLAAILGWIVGAHYALTRMSGLAWWMSAWIVTVGGASIGRLVSLAAFVAVLVLFALRRPRAPRNVSSRVP